MERRQDDLGGGALLFLQFVDGDAAAIVFNGAAVVGVQHGPNVIAMPGDRLVDHVDHLVYEVVQPARSGRADVHPGALSHRLEAFEDGDVLGAVGAGSFFFALPLAVF